jgi:hypothetical protein
MSNPIVIPNNCIVISKERLVELLNAEEELIALEAAGVDNWDGYDEREDFQEEWTLEDLSGQDIFEG